MCSVHLKNPLYNAVYFTHLDFIYVLIVWGVWTVPHCVIEGESVFIQTPLTVLVQWSDQDLM